MSRWNAATDSAIQQRGDRSYIDSRSDIQCRRSGCGVRSPNLACIENGIAGSGYKIPEIVVEDDVSPIQAL